MSEESRALAYQAQTERRAEFRAANQRRIQGSNAAATLVREAWAPVTERTRPGERENEEKRPDGVANG